MFATREDVRNGFEGVIPSNRDAWLDEKLAHAESLLITRVPSIATTTDQHRLDLAKSMVVEAILRVYRNPSGAQQETASVFSVARGKDAASPVLFFPSEDLAALRPKKSRRVGTIRTAPWRVDVYGR